MKKGATNDNFKHTKTTSGKSWLNFWKQVPSDDDNFVITCPYFTKHAWMVRLVIVMHQTG